MEKRCDVVCLYIFFYNNNFLKEIYYKCYSVFLFGKIWLFCIRLWLILLVSFYYCKEDNVF